MSTDDASNQVTECDCGAPTEPGEKACGPCQSFADHIDRQIDEMKEAE